MSEERREGRARPDEPEFGPSGYLPEKAARRARKIILRAPLGLQWVVAALAAGAVIAVTAAVFFARAGGPPGEPYVAVGTLEELGTTRHLDDPPVVVVTATGRVRAFVSDPADPVGWCAESRRLESPSGRVWSATGRGLDGGESLREHPTIVVDGTVYLDPESSREPEPSEDAGVAPACS